MHFHLPKPLHGWRALAGEVGVIVIGVVLALAAEQAVESIHWRREVTAERASLRQEVKDSLNGIAERRREQGCVDTRLAEVRTVMLRHVRGEPLGIVGPLGSPTRISA